MRISSIELSWFRGASEAGILETDFKNVVVYGANGSGKSSFVDAMEYIISDGKIRHLTHEYSGRKQEKGIINTHIPDKASASVKLSFAHEANIQATINRSGDCSYSCDPKELTEVVQSWSLERLVLRQDEVAKFINYRKGEKYSALVPLLGLEDFETAAQNTSALIRYLIDESERDKKRLELQYLENEIKKHFPDPTEEKIYEKIYNFATDYIDGKIPENLSELADSIRIVIGQRVESLEPEVIRHSLMKNIDNEDLPSKLVTFTTARDSIYGKIDRLLDTRISILKQSTEYISATVDTIEAIQCPACGREIDKDEFIKHVNTELETLSVLVTDRESALEAEKQLNDAIDRLLISIEDQNISVWLNEKEQLALKEAFNNVKIIRVKSIKERIASEDIVILKTNIHVIDVQVKSMLTKVPPSTKKLMDDSNCIETGIKIFKLNALQKYLGTLDIVLGTLKSCESAIREHIRTSTEGIISGISKDVRHLWSRLHPREPIEDIQLYQPEDEKSIDISLKYFGVSQPSPRLTLSEGHRNSLGLCIFLALVRQSNDKGCIFLDDIVSSFDREHRGNVKDILLEDLRDYQVLLFTHDREWFYELRYFWVKSHNSHRL